jgi:hypothetical protein
MVLISVCLLSPYQTQQIYYAEHVRRLNITFTVLYITFSPFPLPSAVPVDPLQSTYVSGNGRWQVKPFNPGQRQLHGRQIDTTFTVIANGRQTPGPIASRPIPDNPMAAAPVSQPPVSPDIPAATPLIWRWLRNFWYIPERCWCTVSFVLPLN